MRPPAPWTILDIDLAAQTGSFDPAIDRPALVILRHRGAVLGRGMLLPPDPPLTPEEFASFAGRACGESVAALLRLGADDRRPGPTHTPLPPDAVTFGAQTLQRLDTSLSERRARPIPCTASVIICTRHRPGHLAGCLEAIAPEIAAGREVIVVDNGPDDATRSVAEAAGVLYLAEPVAGLSRARNRGIAVATGEVAVFVDDDMRPEPGWVDALLRRFDDPAVAAVTGLILPAALETEAQIGAEHDLGPRGMDLVPVHFDAGFLEGWPDGAPLWEIGSGANMAVRRSAAFAIGGFDEHAGPGSSRGGFEDIDFWHEALCSRHAIRYEPLAVVRRETQETLRDLKRQAYRYEKWHLTGHFLRYGRTGRRTHLRRAFRIMPRRHAGRMLRAPGRYADGTPDRLLWSCLRGYMAGLRHVGLMRAAPGPVSSLEKMRHGE